MIAVPPGPGIARFLHSARWPVGFVALLLLVGCKEHAQPPADDQGNQARPVQPNMIALKSSANNLRQIALAMHSYHDTFGHFPPAAITSRDGRPLLSWRVAILPFLDQNPLYRAFKLDEPWDSAQNKPLLAKMPSVYTPVRGDTGNPFATYFQVFTAERLTGKDPVFVGNQAPTISEITDGTSKTFLVVEAGEPVPWTQPTDLSYAADKPLPRLGGSFADGFNAAFADGNVTFIKKEVPENLLRAMITRDGGDDFDMEKVPSLPVPSAAIPGSAPGAIPVTGQ